ncbi:MAG TPA: formate dehydrogenase accessory sulfurtransferase FdhD [Verrucomicrobiae bacterium]|jgi:FdhD protein|nr:formate dehydrogenase accessory sulfurtransferase FdhD [Verrucomicrobiae bacterium]
MKIKPGADRQIEKFPMQRVDGPVASSELDCLAAEVPLEIRVEGQSVAVVMRTPGDDRELAAGFLATEGLIRSPDEVIDIIPQPHCLESTEVKRETNGSSGTRADLIEGNVVNVQLKQPHSLDLKQLTRHVFTSSSCGICSKASIEAVRRQFPAIEDEFEVGTEIIRRLPSALASAQETFKRTGGLHACALFDVTGRLVILREDVGRHNALDKVVGWALLKNQLPLRRHILLLSGRTSFEMMQKALAAGVPIVAAISAPSSLAVEFARDSGQTLIGFLRGQRMNIYSGAHRVRR